MSKNRNIYKEVFSTMPADSDSVGANSLTGAHDLTERVGICLLNLTPTIQEFRDRQDRGILRFDGSIPFVELTTFTGTGDSRFTAGPIVVEQGGDFLMFDEDLIDPLGPYEILVSFDYDDPTRAIAVRAGNSIIRKFTRYTLIGIRVGNVDEYSNMAVRWGIASGSANFYPIRIRAFAGTGQMPQQHPRLRVHMADSTTFYSGFEFPLSESVRRGVQTLSQGAAQRAANSFVAGHVSNPGDLPTASFMMTGTVDMTNGGEIVLDSPAGASSINNLIYEVLAPLDDAGTFPDNFNACDFVSVGVDIISAAAGGAGWRACYIVSALPTAAPTVTGTRLVFDQTNACFLAKTSSNNVLAAGINAHANAAPGNSFVMPANHSLFVVFTGTQTFGAGANEIRAVATRSRIGAYLPY